MAREPFTIPVEEPLWDQEQGKIHNLPYDTRVLLWPGVGIDDIEIFPYSSYYRRKFVLPGQLAKHYEIRYSRTLLTHFDKPDPKRGRIITHLSPLKLEGLEPRRRVLFQVGGTWKLGEILEYVDRKKERQASEKSKKKAKYKHRKYLRQPTVWDRITQD